MKTARFASATVSGGTFVDDVDRAADAIERDLDGEAPDLVFAFVTPAYGKDAPELGARLRERLEAQHVVGCTGSGVLGTSGEIEKGASLSVLACCLPGSSITTFEARHDQLLTLPGPDAVAEVVGVARDTSPQFVVFADPFTLDTDLLLAQLASAYGNAPATGGLASGATRPGRHLLYRNGEVARFGAVGVAISGHPMRTVVSQGCRPVGRRFIITRADHNKLLQLSGKPALTAIQDTIESLSEDDRQLARTSLLLGRVTDEARDDFGPGDFVVRNLMGVVPDEGAVVVGDTLRVGQTVQLQLRDRHAATDDLERLLEDEVRARGTASAALVFSCAGRGKHLFGAPDHDVQSVRRHLGPVPLAGFFCNGEIGAVGARNFVHGFTASLALL